MISGIILSVSVTNANYEELKVDSNPWLFQMLAEEIDFVALANKDLRNLVSKSFPKKSFLKNVDQKAKIHLEKFKELNQVLNETEKNIRCYYFQIDKFKKIKIKQHDFSLLHLNIPGYNTEDAPTEASAGGVRMFISQTLQYKVRKGLQIYYPPKKLELVFMELLFPNKLIKFSNNIYGLIPNKVL